MKSTTSALMFSTQAPDPKAKAEQRLHVKINKQDLNEEGSLISSETIKKIMDYHQAHPKLKKLNKYNPEVQNLFAGHETPRSILFFADKMVILYRDFSKDTVTLNLLFETEVPQNLWKLHFYENLYVVVDQNKKPIFFINNNRERIPCTAQYSSELTDIINANMQHEPAAQKVILQSEHVVFKWLKSTGIIKRSIQKKEGKLGSGSTTKGGVKLAQNPVTREWVAVKRLEFKVVSTEESALRKLGEFYGDVTVDESRYIAGKLHHGIHIDKFDVYSFIKEREPLNAITQIIKIMHSLARQIQRLHNLGILHHDINPGNFLVDSAMQCVHIVDFGQSRRVEPDDFRIKEENMLITQYLQSLAFWPKRYFLEELVKEHNKNLFFCLSYFPDKTDNFNLVPFIQRLDDTLNNRNIQAPKEKMDEFETRRKKHMEQIAMPLEDFYGLIKTKNEQNQLPPESVDKLKHVVSDRYIEIGLEQEFQNIKTRDIDLENVPKNVKERNKMQVLRDEYMRKLHCIKNNAIDTLDRQTICEIFVKYQIVKICDVQLAQFTQLQKSSTVSPCRYPL